MRLAALAVVALVAVALLGAGCGGRGSDKVGGVVKPDRRQLTLAYAASMPSQIDRFSERVRDLSRGSLGITYREGWRRGRADFEAATIRDVAAGRIEMAVVGARAFDRVGVTSFQPLLAPLLVDSYALERKVFEAGIPRRMLGGVRRAGVVGIAVLPGPMRKLLGISRSFRAPADFGGGVVGLQDSALSAATLRALGAQPRAVPPEADLAGLDGYEQQLDSIAGNEYDLHADSVTADVNLWPRPLVVVMNPKVFAALNAAQRAALERAATAAIAPAIDSARTDDSEALTALCNRGITFERADTRALREAVAGVVPPSPALAEITRLKAALGARAEAPACRRSESPGGATSATLPGGTWETTITPRDSDEYNEPVRQRMTIGDRELTIAEAGREPEFIATYSVYRDRVVASGEDVVKARFSYKNGLLRFSDVHAPRPYVVTWSSHPWRQVAGATSPLDGRYEFTITKADLLRVGVRELVLENYGHQRWMLRDGRFRYDQDNGPTCSTWTTGRFSVRGHMLTFRIEDAGGRAPHGTGPDGWLAKPGEVWTYRWSLFRGLLTLHPASGEVSPEPYLSKPWRKVA